MLWPPPISTLTDPLFPYTTLFRSHDLIRILLQRACALAVDQRPHIRSACCNRVRMRLQRERALAADQCRRIGRHCGIGTDRSEEHTSELQSLMRISYAVFCLKKKK